MARGTPAAVANRIGAPVWAERPATGASCAYGAKVGTTITWWGSAAPGAGQQPLDGGGRGGRARGGEA